MESFSSIVIEVFFDRWIGITMILVVWDEELLFHQSSASLSFGIVVTVIMMVGCDSLQLTLGWCIRSYLRCLVLSGVSWV